MSVSHQQARMPKATEALPGREESMSISGRHFVSNNPIIPPFPDSMELALFGLGCFWGAERCFWQLKGVFSTAVGYAGGYTLNPNYQEVCSGLTGHNEVVRVVFDSGKISYARLLRVFFESHDPTQGMRQGNDMGTQYRSGIYTTSDQQMREAELVRQAYQTELQAHGHGNIATEILIAPAFYYAEESHQQYLAKNPRGYCGLGGTGIDCPGSG
ncbi:MAG: peptide-methionine (S)-S-oxide reductase MsrA [Gammaproteobacteria bacterium]|nr:peptide-methionine (S)-S-oxide reductase MsrA [Gammaproteobacteria bacterium]